MCGMETKNLAPLCFIIVKRDFTVREDIMFLFVQSKAYGQNPRWHAKVLHYIVFSNITLPYPEHIQYTFNVRYKVCSL